MGYATESKGYRVFNLNSAKIQVSRDVQFDENACWNWDLKRVQQTITAALESPVQSIDVEDQQAIEATSDTTVHKVRQLFDVYERCNLVHVEPTNYSEAAGDPI